MGDFYFLMVWIKGTKLCKKLTYFLKYLLLIGEELIDILFKPLHTLIHPQVLIPLWYIKDLTITYLDN